MFSPFKVSNFEHNIQSLYKAPVPMNAGAVVDIDPTDTTAIGGSVGFTALTAGSLKLATVANTGYAKAYGITVVNVTLNGPSLQERILELASSYMTVPVGAAVPVFVPSQGDIIATTEYVGYLASDTGALGYLDTTNVANLTIGVGAFQGRFRIAQAGDGVVARYLGNTTVNGALVGLFQF